MSDLLQTAFSALNVAVAALEGHRKLSEAEATGDPAVIQTARDAVEQESNALADRLRALSTP